MQEATPVSPAFDIFNPSAAFKDVELRKEYFWILNDHFGLTITDCYENNTITTTSIIDKVQAEVEYEDFTETFDGSL